MFNTMRFNYSIVLLTLSLAAAEAAEVGYPVVLKTATPGIHHKSDQGGVVLDIPDESALASAYDELAARLGTPVLVSAMAQPGVEMFLGVRRDSQFGPVVLIGFGGIHAETLQDVTFALPPFDAAHATRCVDRLRLRPLLDGPRGAPASDIEAFAQAATSFSILVHALRDDIAELDVNPLIVSESGCIAVDALLVPLTGHQA